MSAKTVVIPDVTKSRNQCMTGLTDLEVVELTLRSLRRKGKEKLLPDDIYLDLVEVTDNQNKVDNPC